MWIFNDAFEIIGTGIGADGWAAMHDGDTLMDGWQRYEGSMAHGSGVHTRWYWTCN